MLPILHLYSTPELGALVVPFATPAFAATMLNLIRPEVSVTSGWLPSSHFSIAARHFPPFEHYRLVQHLNKKRAD